MRILWLDPYHGGSHASVADGYARHSRHEVAILPLGTAGGWRWRMRGAAVSFARALRERPELRACDLIVATDMLDLATFLGLARDLVARTPVALYMHENQLTYPLPPGRQLDLAFPWANYTAALAADAVCFNSAFHRDAFLAALPGLPGRFHDHRELDMIPRIVERSHVLHPGVELAPIAATPRPPPDGGPPIVLWNSRWEYDKAPEAFFEALRELERRGVPFRVIVAGEHVDPDEPAFAAAREWLAPRALWWGYAPSAEAYRALLARADIVVSAAVQEFFGIAVVEGMAAGCVPALPNRLSYPELIPAELHGDVLYEPGRLADRLERTAASLAELRRADFRAVAARFGWEQQAPRYDTLLEQIAEASHASRS